MAERLADAIRFYGLLDRLAARVGGPRFLQAVTARWAGHHAGCISSMRVVKPDQEQALGDGSFGSVPMVGKHLKAIRQAAKKAIDEGYTKYSPSAGREILRKKLSQQASRQFGMPLDSENVFVGNGCKTILFGIFQSLCDPGEEVLLPAPYWLSYPSVIQLSGAKVKTVSTKEENGFKITAQELEQNITEKTKIFLLNSPNNPTSAIYSEEELKSLGEVLSHFPNVTVVCDAIYDRLIFSGKTAPHILSACPELKDRILAVNGASKNYLMTGWRLGWLVGPKEFIKIISSFQSQSMSCANSISQKAFEDAFELCEEDIKSTIRDLKQIRDILTEGLKNISGLKVFPSEGAFFLWVGVKDFLGKKCKGKILNTARDIMEQLLVQKKLLCICGEEFGMPGYLRFSYVDDEKNIKKAIIRLQEFFSELT